MIQLPGFTDLTELGRGSTGIVYSAWDVRFNRQVAIKTMLPAPAAQRTEQCKRFFHEARVVAALVNCDVPKMHSVGEHLGEPYQVREYIEGATLQNLTCCNMVDMTTGIRYVAQVARTVQKVHEFGVVHRNLHPANILIPRQGNPTLIGFGRCGLLDDARQAEFDLLGLKGMLGWLSAVLAEPLPVCVRNARLLGNVGSVGELAMLLGQQR